MKDINNSDVEKMLLTGKSIDELIQMKIQQDYKTLQEKAKNIPKVRKFENISEVPKNLLFSKSSVFKVFNKINGTESLVNGVQAEAMLGMQETVRDALLAGKINAFISGDSYVEFMYAKTTV